MQKLSADAKSVEEEIIFPVDAELEVVPINSDHSSLGPLVNNRSRNRKEPGYIQYVPVKESTDGIWVDGGLLEPVREGEEAGAPARQSLVLRHIPSVPNFRAILWDRKLNPVVFRSARQECISKEDMKSFLDFDIRTIIDLRSCFESGMTDGDRLCDRVYKVYELTLPKKISKFDAEFPELAQVSLNFPEEEEDILYGDRSIERKRILIPMCNKGYFFKVAKEMGGMHVTAVRALGDALSFFKFRFLTRRFVHYFNEEGQWKLLWSYLEYSANVIVAALKIMSRQENLPVCINCHIGKDRTGVLAAIVLTLAGVSKRDVLMDFARTEDGIAKIRNSIRDYMQSQQMYWNEEFLHAFPDDLAKALTVIDEQYGSIQDYLNEKGFTYEEQKALKKTLMLGKIR